jgi:hypothetical protein
LLSENNSAPLENVVDIKNDKLSKTKSMSETEMRIDFLFAIIRYNVIMEENFKRNWQFNTILKKYKLEIITKY